MIEIHNETEYTNEELAAMEWAETETLTSKYSTLVITVYYNLEHNLCKNEYNYGARVDAIDYYEAD